MKFKYRKDTFNFSLGCFLGDRKGQSVFYSYNYEFSFNSFKDYWQEVGRREALIHNLTKASGRIGPKAYSEFEVIQKMAKLDLGTLPGVVLYDINLVEAYRLAERFPGINQSIFTEHLLVMPTKSREAAIALAKALPLSLVRTAAFNEGLFLTDNSDVI